jgi:hypothetical protein
MPNTYFFRIARLLMPAFVLILLAACSKEDDLTDYRISTENQHLTNLQREIEDPFDIRNIRKALLNLQAVDSSLTSFQVSPNHVYLRFFPANEDEMEILKSDTTITLFDFPLNSDVEEGEFHGISSVNNEYPCQYCVVPLDKKLPPVRHEMIYEVFIPPSEDHNTKSASEVPRLYDRLVNESARITGNLGDDTTMFATYKSSLSRWTPSGRIRAWDDLLGMYVPLQHVNVHARWFTHVETCLTDEEGWFRMKSFSHKVNYSIKWENSLFTIRDGLFLQAWYNGPKKRGDWMLDIDGGKSKMFATIHRAAYRQFYGNNLGLSRPRLLTGGRTKICYMNGDGTGQFLGDFSAGGIIPDIQVWGNGTQKKTNSLFGNVSHELGHQIHSQSVGNIQFIRSSKIIRESWAEAVEWAVTNEEYHVLGKKYGISAAANYDHQYNFHAGWPLVDEKDYSPVFIDLIDSLNQAKEIGPGHPNDLISQYTISYINKHLIYSTDINSLKQKLTEYKLDGVDDYKIQELFLLY